MIRSFLMTIVIGLTVATSFGQAIRPTLYINALSSKVISVHSADGLPLSSIEIPAGVWLSIEADEMGPRLEISKDSVAGKSGGKTASCDFSGKISIRGQLTKDMKQGQGAEESFVSVPLMIDLANAKITVLY